MGQVFWKSGGNPGQRPLTPTALSLAENSLNVPLAVQNANDLKRLPVRTVNKDLAWKLMDRPKPDWMAGKVLSQLTA